MLFATLCAFFVAAVTPGAEYDPTPMPVAEAMLDLAAVRPDDVVYDLGCGDGRIVIAAARRGARGVCVDIDPKRIRQSRANAKKAGVADRIRFREEDLLRSDLSDATVVMLFLSPELANALRPKLEKLKPGSRIVAHWYPVGDWKPDQVVKIRGPWGRERTLFLWRL